MSLKSLFGIRVSYAPFLAAIASLWVGHHGIWAQGVSFSQPAISHLAVGGRPTTPVIADFNGDGRADIVVALEGDHAIAVLLGRPQGGFQPAPGSPVPAGNSPFSIAVADLNGDTQLDVVAVNRTDNQLTVLRGDGLGGFTPWGSPVPTSNEPRTVRIADFNRDGKPDLAVANYGAQSVSILLGDGLGVFTPAPGSPVLVGRNPWGLTVADFNGDSALDFAVANRADNSVSVMLNDKNATFKPAGSPIAVGSQPFDVTSADLNNDGKVDLISADTWSTTITAFLGEGTGSFNAAVGGNVPVHRLLPRMVVAADLNLDGHLDLVTANERSSISLLEGNGSGSFNHFSGLSLQHPIRMNTVAVGDLNGDGAPDLVGCGPVSGIKIWLNARIPEAFVVSAPTVWESDRVAKVTLRRILNLTTPLTFKVSTRDDTAKAGHHYRTVQLQATFEPNQKEIVLSIPLINDDFGTGTHQFFLEFSEANPKAILPWAVPVWVHDDDELVTVRAEVGGSGLLYHPDFGWPFFPEGTGPIRFTARRSGSVNSSREFQVHYRVDGRDRIPGNPVASAEAAVPGTDFIVAATEGVFQFGPGVTERSIEVTLPNDSVPRGNRGIAIRLSYEDIVNQGGDEVIAFILDDERRLLSQEVALEPYLPAPIGNQSSLGIKGLANGKSLVIRDTDTVLRLTPEGLPDLTFGQGTGRAILPSWPFPHESWEALRLDRELEDGRLQLRSWSSDRLVRLTADGVPDRSFGGGTGQLTIPGSLLDTMPDGGLLLVSEDGHHLKRLLPDGSVDASFSTSWTAESGFYWARVSPQGQIWAAVDSGLHLFHATGEPVLDFVLRPGVELFRGATSPAFPEDNRAYFDSEGRAYFVNSAADAFGDSTQGSIVRFLADGTYDANYRPVPPGVFAELADLDPDGTALAILGGNELVELDPSGRRRSLYHAANDQIGAATRQSDGTVLLSFVACGLPPRPMGCPPFSIGILTLEGQLVPTGITPNLRRLDSGSLYRSTLNAERQQVGLPHSGRYVLESTASFAIQRSGSTANPATVHGRVFPLLAGRWQEALAQPFEVNFPVGQADTELLLPQLAQPGRQPLREYLVRLESTAGVELSEFNACRLWVLDDEALLSPGELSLERFAGDDEQNSALLLGRWESRNPQGLEFRTRLDLPWEGWEIGESPGFSMLDPYWLEPVPTDGTTSGFFRMRTP